MASRKRRMCDQAELNLTPMIDVVFQLIIFFIVTVHIEDQFNEDIILEKAPQSTLITSEGTMATTLTIEVDKNGRLYLHNVPMSWDRLRMLIQNRYNRFGEFPVLIRGDWRTRHRDIRRVMDMCSGIGLWQVQFVAIKEEHGG